MKNYFLLILAFSFLCYSCSDDDDNGKNPPEKETKSYLPLATGNYWIYDIYYISEEGGEIIERKRETSDTIVITGEEIYNGKKYYIRNYKNNSSFTQALLCNPVSADSAGYLINKEGKVLFSNVNFSDVIRTYYETSNNGDTIYSMTGKMEHINKPVTVPAGTFNDVLNLRQTVLIWNRPLSEEKENQNPKYLDTYYSKDVGIIYHTSTYLSSPTKIEFRLAKYHIDGVTYPKE